MPDDAEFQITFVRSFGRAVQGYGNDGLVKHLKALADNHTKLEAVKDAAKAVDIMDKDSWRNLESAIKEAEADQVKSQDSSSVLDQNRKLNAGHRSEPRLK